MYWKIIMSHEVILKIKRHSTKNKKKQKKTKPERPEMRETTERTFQNHESVQRSYDLPWISFTRGGRRSFTV